MPVSKTAIRNLRKSKRKFDRNHAFKKKLVDVLKEFKKLIAKGHKDEAAKKLPGVYSILDHAEKKNMYHKNKTARKKAQMSKLLKEAK